MWEWLYDKLAGVGVERVAGWLTDMAGALPVLAVVCGVTYIFIAMVSKKLAKLAVIAVLVYGAYIIK